MAHHDDFDVSRLRCKGGCKQGCPGNCRFQKRFHAHSSLYPAFPAGFDNAFIFGLSYRALLQALSPKMRQTVDLLIE
ncbi:hypothetical protein [Brucella melitensis]|uniref:hypothetical protein n=1 Tax=Brucella melitensis TaxID=29459 RepID=UPI0002EEE126